METGLLPTSTTGSGYHGNEIKLVAMETDNFRRMGEKEEPRFGAMGARRRDSIRSVRIPFRAIFCIQCFFLRRGAGGVFASTYLTSDQI